MASQTTISAYRPRFATAVIAQLIFAPAEVKDGEVVRTDFSATFLAAMHEVTAAAFLVAEILILPFGELSHAAEVCIGSVCMFMSSWNVGLAWRYWYLSSARSKILAEPPTRASRFKKFTVIMVALSSNLACCIWLIPKNNVPSLPAEIAESTVRGIATLIICLYATCLYGAHLGNLLEAQDSARSEAITVKDKVFAGIYGILMIFFLCANGLTNSELFYQVVGVFWSACLLLVYRFMPPEQPVVTTWDVACESEVSQLERKFTSSRQSKRVCKCPRFLEYLSFVTLLNAPIEDGLVRPNLYLAATHEVFGLTLIITWGFTIAIPMLRTQIFDHPAKVIIGSYNPCFGWDYFPASWVAVCLCSFNVYFSFRYSWLASLRRAILRGQGETTWASAFSTAAAYALSISCCLWVCLWLLGQNPKDPVGDLDGPEIFWWSVHTAIFVFMAGAEYLTYLGLLLDIGMSPRREAVTTGQKVFAAVYGYCCLYLLFVYGFNLAFHDKGSGVPALGSGAWTQVSDLLWIASINGISYFLPEEPPLRQKIEVLPGTASRPDWERQANSWARPAGSSDDPEAGAASAGDAPDQASGGAELDAGARDGAREPAEEEEDDALERSETFSETWAAD